MKIKAAVLCLVFAVFIVGVAKLPAFGYGDTTGETLLLKAKQSGAAGMRGSRTKFQNVEEEVETDNYIGVDYSTNIFGNSVGLLYKRRLFGSYSLGLEYGLGQFNYLNAQGSSLGGLTNGSPITYNINTNFNQVASAMLYADFKPLQFSRSLSFINTFGVGYTYYDLTFNNSFQVNGTPGNYSGSLRLYLPALTLAIDLVQFKPEHFFHSVINFGVKADVSAIDSQYLTAVNGANTYTVGAQGVLIYPQLYLSSGIGF